MTASQAYRQARIEGHTQQIFATMGAFRELYRKHGVDAVHRNRLRIHNAMDSLEAQLQQGPARSHKRRKNNHVLAKGPSLLGMLGEL